MIKNFLTCEKEVSKNSHGGEGAVDLYKVWDRDDFVGNWDFACRVVMPSKSSMGVHKHGQNEEMYIILEGEGTMTINSEKVKVKKGDMILNEPNGEHGLINDSDKEIELLIMQARL